MIVNYRADEAGAAETVATIAAAGGQATPCQADVSQTADLERMVAAVEAGSARSACS